MKTRLKRQIDLNYTHYFILRERTSIMRNIKSRDNHDPFCCKPSLANEVFSYFVGDPCSNTKFLTFSVINHAAFSCIRIRPEWRDETTVIAKRKGIGCVLRNLE